LLTLSRQGRTPKSAIDLNQAVSTCLGGGARFIPEANSGVRLMIDLCPRSLTVIASEAHLARALVNLVHNAVDAIAGSGDVVVRTRAKRLQQPHFGYETIPIGDYALIEVSDTGVGLQTDSVGRLFEPFFSTKELRDQSGTGLGLAIVHGVVKEHDGFIDVRSEPGKGTTFSLYFPLSQETASSQFPESARAHGRARILMVDDDPAQLRTARRVLMHYGHEVDTLTGSQQALELFNRLDGASDTPYALVILDMHLGDGADGLAVLHHIHARWPGQRAIMVSGHAPDDRIALALEARIPWLAKPYTADALASIVRDTLDDRPSASLRISSKPPVDEE
jgi:CheY-like chemotaxis protein